MFRFVPIATAAAFACVLTCADRATAQPAPEGLPPPRATEERLQALEAQNLKLQTQLEQLLSDAKSPKPPADAGGVREAPLLNLPNQLGRPRPPETDKVQDGKEAKPGARVDLEQGLRIFSPDGRFRFEFHNLSQFDARFFNPTGDPLQSNFVIPRQRVYFGGVVDEKYEFYTTLNRGYGTLDLLDGYTGYRLNKQINFRFGRMKTPYTYEYFKMTGGDLIAPERSVFVANLSPNRQIGALMTGRLFDERLEYALGLFNGPQRSFQDYNNYKNPFVFANYRPFLLGGSDFARYMNFGASYNYGRENDPLEPNALHTANDETTNTAVDNVSPAFLRFNSNITQVGEKSFWAGEFNWFYGGFTTQVQYNGGFITYALKGQSTRVPYSGGSAALTYFVTGEEPTTRKEVVPLRDFDIADPLHKPGAVELFGRVADLTAGSEIFEGGLANPKLWSREAVVTDVGAHWYPNRYVRVTLDYQYAKYGSDIQIAPGKFTDSTNIYWLRTQLYY